MYSSVSLSAKNTKETKLFVLTCAFGGRDIKYDTHFVCLFPLMSRMVCLSPQKCNVQYAGLYEFYFVRIYRSRLTIHSRSTNTKHTVHILVPQIRNIQYNIFAEFYFVLIYRSRLTIQHRVWYEIQVYGFGFSDGIVRMCAFAERDIQYTAMYAIKIQDLVFGI